jgi:hypothetical protein
MKLRLHATAECLDVGHQPLETAVDEVLDLLRTAPL